MTDGTAVQLALIRGLLATGRWTDRRASNLFDGAAPFYRTYRTSDGGYMVVVVVALLRGRRRRARPSLTPTGGTRRASENVRPGRQVGIGTGGRAAGAMRVRVRG
ncbi:MULTISPECIES: hypothetical protein [unclassified Streptomyces]|uniref:hypothetical protein n=1 Tax=unclassified Streptomyces TaxID=2593676 RepID=UPI002E37B6D6|nr:hypothetical protein [Streptomyces sp. NBC_01724]